MIKINYFSNNFWDFNEKQTEKRLLCLKNYLTIGSTASTCLSTTSTSRRSWCQQVDLRQRIFQLESINWSFVTFKPFSSGLFSFLKCSPIQPSFLFIFVGFTIQIINWKALMLGLNPGPQNDPLSYGGRLGLFSFRFISVYWNFFSFKAIQFSFSHYISVIYLSSLPKTD